MQANLTTSQRRLQTLAANQRKEAKRQYVFKRLREVGLDWIELARSEANYLPDIIHGGEKIGGAIAGRSDHGHIMIVATDRRVIVIDCKPIFKDTEDITYFVVAGVDITNMGPIYSVTLQTRLGDFKVTTLYAQAARRFQKYIDRRCIEHQNGGKDYDPPETTRSL